MKAAPRHVCLAAAAALLCVPAAFAAAPVLEEKTAAPVPAGAASVPGNNEEEALPAGTAAAAKAPGGNAEGDEGPDEASSLLESLTVGLEGSRSRAVNERDYDWGPTLSLSLLSSGKTARYGFNYELEGSYNESYSKLTGTDNTQETRVRSAELKYCKFSLLRFAGYDFKERLRLVPYISGGVQRVNSREKTKERTEDALDGGVDGNGDPLPEIIVIGEATEVKRESYWSPTWGAGMKFSLNRRAALTVDYEQNMAGRHRRISRLSLGLSVSIFGDTDD